VLEPHSLLPLLDVAHYLRFKLGVDSLFLGQFPEAGKVYKVTLQPMTTSNYFTTGHSIRIEVSSNNYDEAKGLVAHNIIHHSRQYPSQVTLTVVKHPN
jgi:predicted acyl esterase